MTKQSLYETKLLRAMYLNSWRELIPYPKLLYYWQRSHTDDLTRIATVASHVHTRKHTFCKDEETVDKWVRYQLHKGLIQALKRKMESGEQQRLV